jgi:hypothetical protein
MPIAPTIVEQKVFEYLRPTKHYPKILISKSQIILIGLQ